MTPLERANNLKTLIVVLTFLFMEGSIGAAGPPLDPSKRIHDVVYVPGGCVRVSYDDRTDRKFTANGTCINARISGDTISVGWLVQMPGEGEPKSHELQILYKGRMRSIYARPGTSIWDWQYKDKDTSDKVGIREGVNDDASAYADLYQLSDSSATLISHYDFSSKSIAPAWVPLKLEPED